MNTSDNLKQFSTGVSVHTAAALMTNPALCCFKIRSSRDQAWSPTRFSSLRFAQPTVFWYRKWNETKLCRFVLKFRKRLTRRGRCVLAKTHLDAKNDLRQINDFVT